VQLEEAARHINIFHLVSIKSIARAKPECDNGEANRQATSFPAIVA
jgi:hypothetical protein